VSIVLGVALLIGLGWFIAWQSMKIDALEQQLKIIQSTHKAKVEINAKIKTIDSNTDVCKRADEYNQLWETIKARTGSSEM
jgi:hypothetical protein